MVIPSHGAPIELTDAGGGLAIVTYLSGATDEQYEAHLDNLTQLMHDMAARHHFLAQVHDATRWSRSTARQRQMQAEWIEKNRRFMEQHGAGLAFVITSALVRGGLTAVLWLSGMPLPYKVFGEMDRAQAWCQSQVAKRRGDAMAGVQR